MKNKIIFLVLGCAIVSLTSFQLAKSKLETPKKGLTKIAIMYPNGEDKTFDMDYYATKHMPMCADLFGDGLKHLEIDKGIAGRTPEEPMPYLAVGYFYFESLSAYQEAFGPNAEKILGDIPNYTNIRPVVQISEVVK